MVVSFSFGEELDGRINFGTACVGKGGLVRDPLVVVEVHFRFFGEVRDDHVFGKNRVAGG